MIPTLFFVGLFVQHMCLLTPYPNDISVDNKIKIWKQVRVILDLIDFYFSSSENPKVVMDCKILYTYFSHCVKSI